MNIDQSFFIDYNETYKKKVAPTHDHSVNEIIFVLDGEADFIVDNTSYQLKKNSMIFISSFKKHELIKATDIYKRYYILCDAYMLSSLYDSTLASVFSLNSEQFSNVITLSDEAAETIANCFQAMLVEYNANTDYTLTRLRLLLCDMLILLYRYNKEVFRIIDDKSYVSLVNKVRNYLDIHFKEELTLKSVADLHFTNMSYLSTKFKETFGCTFKKYLTTLRIDYAKYLLTNTSSPVSEIPYLCGFNDQTNFLRKFKEIIGSPPMPSERKLCWRRITIRISGGFHALPRSGSFSRAAA